MPASEELELELEALIFTYGSDNVTIDRKDDCVDVFVAVHPRESDPHRRFVQALLRLTAPPGYPASGPPAVAVADSKGLGDERQARLLDELRREAGAQAGELVLGHLVEVAADTLSELNHPEGHCIFCLEGMEAPAPPPSGRQDAAGGSALVKLPCYHVFHVSGCYADWWAWQQHAFAQAEAELRAHTGVSAAARLRDSSLPPTEPGPGPGGVCYRVCCPVCRCPTAFTADLSHVSTSLQVRLSLQRRSC